MKALLGLVQIGLGVAGFIALLNQRWMWMIAAWIAASLVGLAGNRMVRNVEGISETGRAAVADVSRAIELLRRGEFAAATGVTRSAVSSFRMGGDRVLLPVALTIHAVALASVRDATGSQRALEEASRLLRNVPTEFAADVADLRRVHELVQGELDHGVPDPSGMVASFIAFNDHT